MKIIFVQIRKKLLEKSFLTFKKWVEKIQTAGYNDARTVTTLLECETPNSNIRWVLFLTSVLESCGGIYPRKFVAQTLQIFISDVKHMELTS